jgi:hypothetical protein
VMKYIGLKPGGEETVLPAPAEAVFDFSEDAPADLFRGVFPLAESFGTLTGLRVEDAGGETFFLGTADVQREIFAGAGSELRLSCRSLAGLLLDSEPIPQIYEYPDLATIFARHVRPYGFTSCIGETGIFRGPLRVTKGMSEWQTAALFCKTYLQTAPRVRGSVFDATGGAAGTPLLLDNSAGTRFFRAELRQRCCDRISEVYALSSSTGAYVPAASDAETSALGIVRRRCLTASADGAALLKAADRKAFAVLADCPGMPQTCVGASAALRDKTLGGLSGLTVAQVTCTLGSGGVFTRYLLRKD